MTACIKLIAQEGLLESWKDVRGRADTMYQSRDRSNNLQYSTVLSL